MTTTYRETIQETEKHLFEATLSENQYNVSKTAKLLGISRGTLQHKLRSYFGNRFVTTRKER